MSIDLPNELWFFLQFSLCMGFLLGCIRWGEAALIAFVALQGILANLFILKQIDLFGLVLTCSDVFVVASLLGLNLLQEFFGKEAAGRAMRISCLLLLFFTLASQVHLAYVPAAVDQAHDAFQIIFASTLRIVLASLAVYALVQKIDIAFFGFLKRMFTGRFLAFRLLLSLLITQGIDTVLFSFAALYGVISPLFDVMVVSYLIKCLIIGTGAPLAALSRRFLQRAV